ncbi:hypothetical protein MPER_06060 [Moniliophthora perniciosa FA553]|nr:hypothetical protein MPER_06060 [Moniliophthora perniciosa FA553]
MTTAGNELVCLVAEALGLCRDGLAKFAADSDDEMLHFSKIVKYPVPKAENLSSQGVGAHVDPGFITMLLQASDHPGLQVQNLVGDWIDVLPIPGTFVVNFGRALEYATQGIVRATSHRVLSPPLYSTTPRYSVPYFHNLSLDVRLSDPQYRIQFSEEVLRLRDIRGKLPETDASNYKEMTTETFGMASLIGRIKYAFFTALNNLIFIKLFPNGLPEHLRN